MSYGEAIRLLGVLAADPSSMFAASREGWAHPISHEAAVLMDLYDLQHASKSKKKPKPYPRPWPAEGTRRRGKTTLSRAEVVAVLNQHGHSLTA